MLCLDASYLNWKGTWDCQMPVCLCLVRKDSIGKGTFIRDLRGLFLLAHAASLFFCGSLLGSLVVGLFAEQLGRRKGILFGTSASLGGNLLLVFAQSVAMAMIARVIMGVAFGVQLAQVSVYTSEVSQPVLRPVVGGLAMCCITIGFALTHFVGALVRWRFMVMVNTSICGVVLLVQIFILVESHKWLMQKGREAEARKILSELRHNEDVVEEELDSIEFNIREQKKRKTSYASFIQESNISKFQTFIGIFTKGTFVRPFIVALFVRTAPIFNGLLVINQFLVMILEQGELPFDANWIAAFLTAGRAFVCILSLTYIKKVKRVPTYIISLSFCALGSTVLFIHYDFQTVQESWLIVMEKRSDGWVSLASVCFTLVLPAVLGKWLSI